jgi:hypothetical protein
MASARSAVGPPWPPSPGAYDFLLTLSEEELAWEFLRRNPDYQQAYRRHRRRSVSFAGSHAGLAVWRVETQSPAAAHWGLCAFVDPALGAGDAPFCWRADAGGSELTARAYPSVTRRADLRVAGSASIPHAVIGPGPVTRLLIRTTDRVLTLAVSGPCALHVPIRLVLVMDGLAHARAAAVLIAALPDVLAGDPRSIRRSRWQLFHQRALIALDGRSHGASYRQIAVAVVGAERARSAWLSPSRALKDLMCRAVAKGEALRDGAYRELLASGVSIRR